MITTRENDLDKLDQARFDRKTEGSREHIQAILAMVYVQSKDSTLELLRKKLVEALRYLEENGDGLHEENWNRYIKAIDDIEKYCTSPAFIKKMHEAILKEAGIAEAERYEKTHEKFL